MVDITLHWEAASAQSGHEKAEAAAQPGHVEVEAAAQPGHVEAEAAAQPGHVEVYMARGTRPRQISKLEIGQDPPKRLGKKVFRRNC